MSEVVFKLKRDYYGLDSEKRETTLGQLFKPDNSFYCYTLEDVVRPFGVKRKTSTAIPANDSDNLYYLGVRKSPKYGEVVVIYTHKDGDEYTLEYNGVKFEYILLHGGNHADHTDGCVLVNKNRETVDGKMATWGSMKNDILNEVKKYISEGKDVRLQVTNLPQEG